MTYEEQYIKNKLKGSLAEQLFELLHFEMGCQVYRTGQEFLYPHLFLLANTKKKIAHRHFYERDYQDSDIPMVEELIDIMKHKIIDGDGENWAKEWKNRLKKEVGKIRFEKSATGTNLASSPDFTIVSPSGCIEQFEVKFRSNGKLTDKEKEKYLRRDAMPNIFVIMAKEPYIKILKPWLEEIPIDYSRNFKDVIKQMESWKKRTYAKERWYYNELERENDGSLIFRSSSLKSEQIIYPRELLKKYERVIREWFCKK